MGALKVVALILVLVTVAVGYQWSAIDRLIYALVIFLIFAFVWSRLSLRGLTVVRALASDRAQVGQTVREEVTLRNRGWQPKLWIEVRDYSNLPGHELSRVVSVGARGGTQWERTTVCWQRGRFRMGPLALHSGDPFGLFTVRRTVPITHELIVYPSVFDLSAFPLPMAALHGGRAQTRPLMAATPSIGGVRDYVSGDPLNRISWSATARTGKMMVKELDPDPTADVWVVLDFDADVQWQAAGNALGGSEAIRWLFSTEEYGVAIAASLAQRCLDEGRDIGLIVNRGQPMRIMPDHNERQWSRIFELLAVATAEGSRPLASQLSREAVRFTPRTAVIVVTPSQSQEWVTAVASLRNRRVPVTAIVLDPSTFDDSGPSSAPAVEALLGRGVGVFPIAYGDDPSVTLAARGMSASA